jgi:hypothetical protein
VHRLFVYGTLQHPPLLDHLLGRLPEVRPAVVRGWRAAGVTGTNGPIGSFVPRGGASGPIGSYGPPRQA